MGYLTVGLSTVVATIFIATESFMEDVLKLGVAGACLALLTWFLKQVIRLGVVPFVTNTIEHNAKISTAFTAQAAAFTAQTITLKAIHDSTIETVKIVRRMSARLDEHMKADEKIDISILDSLTSLADTVKKCHIDRQHDGGTKPHDCV